MQLSNLVIEITRQCNIRCDHCLRGEAENKDIPVDTLDKLLSQVSSICDLTISGGEPFLKPMLIYVLLQKLKLYNVDIECIYIATNGTVFPQEIYYIIQKATDLVNDDVRIDISNDEFHDAAICGTGLAVNEYFRILKCVDNKYPPENYANDRKHLLNEGRAKINRIGKREVITSPIETKSDFKFAVIYVNVNGDIINGCDYSYESQEYHILCNVDNLTDYYNNLKDE